MKLKNLTLSILALVISVLGAAADGSGVMTTLVVTPEGEESINLSFDNMPTVTFTEQNLVITTDLQDLMFPLTTKIDFSFTADESAVESIQENPVTVTLINHEITISGMQEGVAVNIYNIAGATVYNGTTDADGSLYINLSDWSTGIYILKSNQLSYKFLLK